MVGHRSHVSFCQCLTILKETICYLGHTFYKYFIVGQFTSRQRSNTDGSLRTLRQSPPVNAPTGQRPQSNVLPTSHSFTDRSALFAGLIRRPSFAQDFMTDYNKENVPQANMSYNQDLNSPVALPYAQSPPNMEGPIMFAVPDLTDETLLSTEHRNTVAKLQFVSSLVLSIIELAQSRTSPLLDSPNINKLSGCVVFVSEKQRRMEQLVLYIRALHVLTSSLQLAKQEVTAGRLHPSATVKTSEYKIMIYVSVLINILD